MRSFGGKGSLTELIRKVKGQRSGRGSRVGMTAVKDSMVFLKLPYDWARMHLDQLFELTNSACEPTRPLPFIQGEQGTAELGTNTFLKQTN